MALVVSWLTRRATRELAERGHREERLRTTRDLAADGFVLAVEAVSWLGELTVEDSVDPQFAATYGPKTERAVAALAGAREKLNKVYALEASGALGEAAGEVARDLGALLYSWESAQNWRRRIVQTLAPKKAPQWARSAFDKAYDGLVTARRSLTGVQDHRLDPSAPGSGLAPSSSLGRLRQAIAAL